MLSPMRNCEFVMKPVLSLSKSLKNSPTRIRCWAHIVLAGYRVIEVVGIISNYLGIANEGLSFGEIGKTVVEISSNAIKLLATVDIVAEINVVHLINVTLIHVTS